jgi:hypothetical protein
MRMSDLSAAGSGEHSPAIRVDPEEGTYQVVEFFGEGSHRMFGCRHLPSREPIAGIVICPSLQAEFLRNYRREVLLGRHLAAAGFVVQRFHYRGTGNSDGETRDVTFESMVTDALAAAERVRRTSRTVAFVGTRVGAIVAAAAAALLNDVPLALWEPVLEMESYFRDAFRGGLIHELKKGVGERRTREDQIEELRQTGTIDVLGYSLDLPLYDSALGRRLEVEAGDRSRPVLLVEVSRTKDLPSEHAALVRRWRDRGFAVTTHVVTAAIEPWWFVGGRTHHEEQSIAAELVGTTSTWLADTVAEAKASR